MEISSSYDNPGLLCAFLLLCGEKAYSWKRLKVVIYHLSAGSEREVTHELTLFPYGFKGDCYAGPDENKLLDLLEWLRSAGYIKITTERIDPKGEPHTMYELADRGKELGLIALATLDNRQRQALQRSADSLKDNGNSVSRLIGMYAKEWDRSESDKILAKTSS